jgi:hypothetical protein
MKESTIKLSAALQDIAGALDEVIEETAGERIGFCLIVFTEERASYISSVDRKIVTEQLKYLLELWEGGMPDVPAHEYKG